MQQHIHKSLSCVVVFVLYLAVTLLVQWQLYDPQNASAVPWGTKIYFANPQQGVEQVNTLGCILYVWAKE